MAEVWAFAKAAGIVIAGRRLSRLEKMGVKLRKLNPGTKVVTVQVGIKVPEDVERIFSKVQSTFGRAADVLIANAGWQKVCCRSGS